MILFDDDLDTLLDFGKSGVEVASHICFAHGTVAIGLCHDWKSVVRHSGRCSLFKLSAAALVRSGSAFESLAKARSALMQAGERLT